MQKKFEIAGSTVSVKETLPDRIVRYFNPVKGHQRLQARLMSAIAGGYVGGSHSRRALSSWITRSSDADSDILPDLPTLRERSRDLVRNTPLATGAINGVCTNVVGTGLKLQSRIDRDVLSLSEEQADAWEAGTEREFRLWAESHGCDAARTLTFAGLQDLVFRSALESGDVFVLLPVKERPGSPYRLRLKVIEGDRVCNEGNKADGERLSGGIERDRDGAPLVYHIMDRHPGSVYSPKENWTKVRAYGRKSWRRNVIHLFRVLRPGQARGVPYLAPVIESLKQLDRYTEAELAAAVVSGMFTVFIKTEAGDGQLAPMTSTAETGNTPTDEDYKLASAAIVGLAPGEDISTANPGRPNDSFDPFVMAVLRQIGVALELPFEILIKHFTSSYSASRAALLEAWKFFNSRRNWLAINFCQIVYEEWMDEAVSIGRLQAPGYFDDPLIRKAYLGAEWVGPAKGMIDELKEIKAARERVDMGVSTLAEVTAELTGGDWEKKHRQSVKEYKLREVSGLSSRAQAQAPTSAEELEETDTDGGDEK